MSAWKYTVAKRVLDALSDLQLVPFPPFFIYGSTAYRLKGEEVRKVLDTVKPGDVILRRYDRYVTSLLVPGYWSHCGIYVGDNAVVHAISKDGVHKEDILTFTRTDELLVLRPFGLTQEELSRVLYRLELICGRPYDYLMDFSEDERFSCTELVKFAFEEVPRFAVKPRTGGLYKGRILPDDLIETRLSCVYTSEK